MIGAEAHFIKEILLYDIVYHCKEASYVYHKGTY